MTATAALQTFALVSRLKAEGRLSERSPWLAAADPLLTFRQQPIAQTG
jgi:hypothetical protein